MAKDPMNELGALIDEANAPFVDDEVALRRARAALLADPPAPRLRAARPRAWFAFAGLLAAAAAAALLVVRAPSRAPASALSFAISGAASPAGHQRAALAARETATDVTFSDGSRVTIAPGGTGEVDTTAAAVTVRLHGGTLRAHVVHRERASWRFVAGPFDVRVTGTRFETGWDETRRQFTLSLAEGGVVVSGPLLGDAGQAVRTGETLRVSVADAAVSWDRPPAPTAPSLPAATLPAQGPPPPSSVLAAAPARATATRTSAAIAPVAAPRWQELARAEQHDEALGLALAAGYATVLETASATELLLLADSARLARAPDRARAALLAVRARFPNSPQAASARFGLARLAFDVDGDLREAAADFQAYLAEAPDGPLAREAAGRLLEARVRLGDHDAAAHAARAYLDRFPDGPRADLARRLLP